MKRDDFTRRFGVRSISELINPRLHSTRKFDLPELSIINYLPVTEGEFGILPNHPTLRETKRTIYVENISELTSDRGSPISTRQPIRELEKKYFRRNRALRPLRNFETTDHIKSALIVENYAMLSHLYRYRQSFFAAYNRWFNIFATMVKRLGDLHSERNHFIPIQLPDRPLKYTDLKQFEKSVSSTSLEPFKTASDFTIAEIFKWLGEYRHETLMKNLYSVDLNDIDLIFIHKDTWISLNLGFINEHRNTTDIDEEGGEEAITRKVSPTEMQKRFLKMLLSIYKSDDSSVVLDTDKAKEEEEADVLDKLAEEESDDNIISEDTLDEEVEIAEVKVPRNTGAQEDDDPADAIRRMIEKKSEDGTLSAREYKKLQSMAERYKTIPNPFGDGTVAEEMAIEGELLKLDPKAKKYKRTSRVKDKNAQNSVIDDFHPNYINNVLKKDILNHVVDIQKFGYFVQDIKVEEQEDAMGKFNYLTIKIQPLEGESSTIRAKIPVIDPDGTFIANNTKYRMRNQRVDLPIRKVAPKEVALTSYYGKIFVELSERSTNNYDRWLERTINAIIDDPDDKRVTDGKHGNVFLQEDDLPKIFSSLAKAYRYLKIKGGIELHLNYAEREKLFDLKKAEVKDTFLIGKKGTTPVVVDKQNVFYLNEDGKLKELGLINDLIPMIGYGPTEYVEVNVLGKALPMGLLLAYNFGLGNVLERIGGEYRRVPAGTRVNISEEEYALRFSDETLVFSRMDREAMQIISGLNRFHRDLKQYSVYEFDHPDIYGNLLERQGLNSRWLQEITRLFQGFVDSITREILIEMNEPKTFEGLLYRSNELLLSDYSPNEVDIKFQRIRGYERVSGAIFQELIRSIRVQQSQAALGRGKVEMNPFSVWQNITCDPAVTLVEESNPVNNLRERETVTFAGNGGRTAQTMMGQARKFNQSDLGVIGESSTDDANVGVTTFLSSNASIKSVRGLTADLDPSTATAANLLGTPANLSVGATYDDPKRVAFIGVQDSSGTFANGYEPIPVVTGYEDILSQRVDDIFAYHAPQDGKVVEVTDEWVEFQYKDGSRERKRLGRYFGKVSGAVFPHLLKSIYTKGQTFKEGDAITYNDRYFRPSVLKKGFLEYKRAVLAYTIFQEGSDTIEDSSAISQRMTKKLGTATTHVRSIVVETEKEIHDLVKIGTVLTPEDALCILADPVNSMANVDQETIDALSELANVPTKSKYHGTVEHIEIYYYGEKEDMSSSARKLANMGDRIVKAKSEATGSKVKTAAVDGSLRIEGNPLELNQLVIQVYITEDLTAGVGYKGVFGNQLKTVFGRVMTGVNETLGGIPIDAFFGRLSVDNRIVNSPDLIGTTITITKHFSKNAADIYFGD